MSSPPHAALTSEWKKTTHIWLEIVKGGKTGGDGDLVLMRTDYIIMLRMFLLCITGYLVQVDGNAMFLW